MRSVLRMLFDLSMANFAASRTGLSSPLPLKSFSMVIRVFVARKLLRDLQELLDRRLHAFGVGAGNVGALRRLHEIAHQVQEHRLQVLDLLEIALAQNVRAADAVAARRPNCADAILGRLIRVAPKSSLHHSRRSDAAHFAALLNACHTSVEVIPSLEHAIA